MLIRVSVGAKRRPQAECMDKMPFMNRLETLLVLLDRRTAMSPALTRGVALARRTGATLTILRCDHDALVDAAAERLPPPELQLLQQRHLANRGAWLPPLLTQWRCEGLTVRGEIAWTPTPHETLIDRVMTHQPDLVIKDIGQEGEPTPTDTDWQVLRLCPVPLMLVRPDAPPLPTHLAAAIDPSGHSPQSGEATLCAAQCLSRACHGEVDLLHVFPFGPEQPEVAPDLMALHAELRQEAAMSFEQFARAHGIPQQRCRLLSGPPAKVMAHYAAAGGIDLLVCGGTYRGMLERLMIGSTPEALLREANSADLLVTRTHEFQNQLARHLDLPMLRRRQAMLRNSLPLPG